MDVTIGQRQSFKNVTHIRKEREGQHDLLVVHFLLDGKTILYRFPYEQITFVGVDLEDDKLAHPIYANECAMSPTDMKADYGSR